MFPVEVVLKGAVKFWNIAEPTGTETLNEGIRMRLVIEDQMRSVSIRGIESVVVMK